MRRVVASNFLNDHNLAFLGGHKKGSTAKLHFHQQELRLDQGPKVAIESFSSKMPTDAAVMA